MVVAQVANGDKVGHTGIKHTQNVKVGHSFYSVFN